MRHSSAKCLVMVVGLLLSTAALASIAPSAMAQEECPLGSVQKTESGSTWCEPTVCETDTNCANGSICRPVALCVEVGVLDAPPGSPGTKPAEAGTKLLVRQRCGADKSCPQKTTCSDKGRCITRAQAEKAGLLTPPKPADPTAPPPDPPKKACGCGVIGARGDAFGGAAFALLGALAISARRRAARRRSSSR